MLYRKETKFSFLRNEKNERIGLAFTTNFYIFNKQVYRVYSEMFYEFMDEKDGELKDGEIGFLKKVHKKE